MERVTEEGLENTGFGNSGAPEGQGTRKNAPDEAQRSQQEQIRASLLGRILTAEARERLSRIAMVRAERARALEDLLINAARNGQLRGSSPQGQITEGDLVGLLERISEQESQSFSKIKYQRRGGFSDDDDDF